MIKSMGEKNDIRYFSMFTGVGGFELGLERATNNSEGQHLPKQWSSRTDSIGTGNIPNSSTGQEGRDGRNAFSCVGFSEIDKYANQLLKAKFPNIPNFGDCTRINAHELPDFDMLCGGFPCQSFSIAGKRRGFQDTRGTMFFEIARILEVKRPKIVWLENVKGLLNHDKGQTFRVIIQTLHELGYDVQWMVLNSKFFGVPQNRERVFIIGSLRNQPRPEILPFRQISSEINELCGQQTNSIKARYTAIGDGSYVAKSKFNAQTQMKIRRLTPTETERLQGFPDGWTSGFSDTQRYKMMGNAVTVNVIQAIAEKLKVTALLEGDGK